MLKPLLFILAVVVLISLTLNKEFFLTNEHTTPKSTKPSIDNPVEAKRVEHPPINITSTTNSTKQEIDNDNNLTTTLDRLMQKANKLYTPSTSEEAQKIYDQIIELTKKSNNPKILEYFADAHFGKAFLYNAYPTNDKEAAIEEYEKIIEKFEDSNSSQLLKIYLNAKLEQAQLLTQEEMLTTYDELIKKFSEDKENRFQTEVEELQFSKSFALMGIDDEAAMEVLDEIIEKYQENGSGKLPQTVHYSILNNIELSIITGNSEEPYVDLANKYLSDSKDTQALLSMLNIVKNAQDIEQEEAFKKWKEEYSDYNFPDWDFSELKNWANNMEDPERKSRVLNYIESFQKQKYLPYAPPSNEESIQNGDASKEEVNQDRDTHQPKEVNNIGVLPNGDLIFYEMDPYVNDIYQNSDDAYQPTYPSPEVIYDNPYLHSNADGVSHTYNEPEEY